MAAMAAADSQDLGQVRAAGPCSRLEAGAGLQTLATLSTDRPQQHIDKRQRLSNDGPPPAAAAAATASPTGTEAADGAAARRLVIIWDLDETLLVFNSLLTGAFAAASRQPGAADRLHALGARWERAILSLCDGRFFFDQVRERRSR